ncbi:Grg1 protein [Meredithblackwellia eburnea MCA 4105]
MSSVGDKISNAANYVSESAKEFTSSASKEANKETAKGNTGASLSERASAGFSAAGDKIDESAHGTKADAHKEAAKH